MTMQLRFGVWSLSLLLAFTGCATRKQTGQAVGGTVGAAGGAAGGYMAAKALGANDTTAALAAVGGGILGAGAGYLIGGAIGEALQPKEREQASDATRRVLDQDTKKPAEWKSDTRSDVHGTSEVVRSEKRAQGGACKDVHEVVYVSGKEINQTSRYCRSAAGEPWVRSA